jgi:hypothetical protein
MTGVDQTKDLLKAPGVVRYILACLSALAIIFVVMLERTFVILALLPVVAGLLGGMTSLGPVLLIVAIAVSLNQLPFAETQFSRSVILDTILCAAVLIYVMAQFRLQSLALWVFPLDPRLRDKRGPEPGRFFLFRMPRKMVRRRRSAGLVSTTEIWLMLFIALMVALLAQLLWFTVPSETANPGLLGPVWHAILVVWTVGIAWFVAAGWIDYRQQSRMTVAEATLYLQDAVWAETRREQRRLNRWLAWSRIRRQRQVERN